MKLITKSTKRIGNLIDKGVISPAEGRSIELFFYGIFLSLSMGILDNLQLMLDGSSVDWKVFMTTFIATTLGSIIAGIQKAIRDEQNSIN